MERGAWVQVQPLPLPPPLLVFLLFGTVLLLDAALTFGVLWGP